MNVFVELRRVRLHCLSSDNECPVLALHAPYARFGFDGECHIV
jgi:hypothetical protein